MWMFGMTSCASVDKYRSLKAPFPPMRGNRERWTLLDFPFDSTAELWFKAQFICCHLGGVRADSFKNWRFTKKYKHTWFSSFVIVTIHVYFSEWYHILASSSNFLKNVQVYSTWRVGSNIQWLYMKPLRPCRTSFKFKAGKIFHPTYSQQVLKFRFVWVIFYS